MIDICHARSAESMMKKRLNSHVNISTNFADKRGVLHLIALVLFCKCKQYFLLLSISSNVNLLLQHLPCASDVKYLDSDMSSPIRVSHSAKSTFQNEPLLP